MAKHVAKHVAKHFIVSQSTMTHIACFKTQGTVVESARNIKRYIVNKLVIYVIYAVL